MAYWGLKRAIVNIFNVLLTQTMCKWCSGHLNAWMPSIASLRVKPTCLQDPPTTDCSEIFTQTPS